MIAFVALSNYPPVCTYGGGEEEDMGHPGNSQKCSLWGDFPNIVYLFIFAGFTIILNFVYCLGEVYSFEWHIVFNKLIKYCALPSISETSAAEFSVEYIAGQLYFSNIFLNPKNKHLSAFKSLEDGLLPSKGISLALAIQ